MAINVSGGGAAGGTPAPTLSTTNSAGSAGTFLRTDDQLAIFDATVPVTQASADAAATGSAAIAARRDHKHGMPTISSGALTRAGGNTTEATTTSVTAADLLSVASLNIAAITPWFYLVSGRKTAGAAAGAGLGLKINTTVTAEAASGTNGILYFGATNEAQDGARTVDIIHGRQTNYLNGTGYGLASVKGATEGIIIESSVYQARAAAFPDAATTDVVIRAISGNALVTVAADELHIYTMATS